MPAMETFGDVLAPYLASGKLIIDPTRFVIEPDFARMGPDLPFLTLRMISMAAEHYEADYVLATVRAEHVVMYRRVIGHKPISEPRTYPMLSRKIVCMIADIETLRATAYSRHPFLQSTPEERAAIFGPRPSLTLLPIRDGHGAPAGRMRRNVARLKHARIAKSSCGRSRRVLPVRLHMRKYEYIRRRR